MGELRAALPLLMAAAMLGPIGRVVCDRAYSSLGWRQAIARIGAEPCVPANRTHPTVPYDRAAYARRSQVERLWARLKEHRAVATRYDKTNASFMSGLYLAAAFDWIP